MAVLNTTSPTVEPGAPMELPIKTVPSASARMAGGVFPLRDKSTGFSGLVPVRPSVHRDHLDRDSCRLLYEGVCFVCARARLCFGKPLIIYRPHGRALRVAPCPPRGPLRLRPGKDTSADPAGKHRI